MSKIRRKKQRDGGKIQDEIYFLDNRRIIPTLNTTYTHRMMFTVFTRSGSTQVLGGGIKQLDLKTRWLTVCSQKYIQCYTDQLHSPLLVAIS